MFWRVTKKEAAACSSSAMEGRDHFKNAANPKSLTSRGKICIITGIITPMLLLMAIMVGIPACEKDKNGGHLNGTYVPKNDVAKEMNYEKFVFSGNKVKMYIGMHLGDDEWLSFGAYEYSYTLNGTNLTIKEDNASVEFTYDRKEDEISLLAGLFDTEGVVWRNEKRLYCGEKPKVIYPKSVMPGGKVTISWKPMECCKNNYIVQWSFGGYDGKKMIDEGGHKELIGESEYTHTAPNELGYLYFNVYPKDDYGGVNNAFVSVEVTKTVNGTFQYTGTGFKYPTRATVNANATFEVDYANGKNGYDEETYSTNFTYSDDYFNSSSTNYDHELATMSLKLAMAAFGLNQDENRNKYDWDNFGERTSNIRALLGDNDASGFGGMGFKNVRPMGYDRRPENKNSIAATFAHRTISGSEMIVIAVRGGLYEREWGDNFRLGQTGNESEHKGFATSRDTVMGYLKKYLEDLIQTNEIRQTSKLKFWITGYSRGAAVANMVAAKLTEEGKILSLPFNISKGVVYAYCFATPKNSRNATSVGFENIFNIINPTDPVPRFAFGKEDWNNGNMPFLDLWKFDRYGITKFLTAPNDGDFNARQSNMFIQLNSLGNPFNESTYTINKFRFHNGNLGDIHWDFPWDFSAKLFDKSKNILNWTVQTYLEDESGLIAMLHAVFDHTPQGYVVNYQESAIRGASEIGEDGKVKGFMGILDDLKPEDENLAGMYFRSTVATLGIPEKVHYNYRGGDYPFSDFETQIEANAHCLEAQRNALAVSQGHFPELYLSWMMSGSDNCFVNK